MKNKILIPFLLLFFFVSINAVWAEDESRRGCSVCGMYIDQCQKTAAEITFNPGKKLDSCGVACMLRIIQGAGGPDGFSSILVRDFNSGQLLKAKQAVYVLSSDLIPDMLPSIIAFAGGQEAHKFQAEHGGKLIDFTQALAVISPMAMTMPTRIQSAVVPAKGAFGIGIGEMKMSMDKVKIDSESVNPREFINRPGQMMGPKKMESSGTMLMANYGITDNLAFGLKTSYLKKEMDMYTMGGNATSHSTNSGLSDTNVSLRYNAWRNTYYNHFITLYGDTTLPTGNFDIEWKDSAGMQLGTGDFTFTAGLLYSYRYNDFWLHSMASYTTKLENSDDYKYGHENRFGVALHHTPNYNLMYGVEIDTVYNDKNEYNEYKDLDIENTGGTRTKLAGIVHYRFLTALGGNFSLRLSAGIPLYEDLNHTTAMGMEKVQLGGGWFGNVAISFKRRFALI